MEIKPSMFTEVNCLGERTYTAAEVAELKAQCAAKIQDIVTLFAKVKASCPEDNSFGSAQRLGITVCIEIAESSIPTEYATALAEHDEQLKQAFSKECARFHEEGRKCATCGREDIEEHYQRSREQGWQEAIKLIQTGTKSYQGQWPTALRDALAEVKRQARLEEAEWWYGMIPATTSMTAEFRNRLAALRAEGDKQP